MSRPHPRLPRRLPTPLVAALAAGLLGAHPAPAAPNPILDTPTAPGVTLIDASRHRVDRPEPQPPEVIWLGREKQLLADDGVIASQSGLQRTLHPVAKHPGNPIFSPEEPWERPAVLLFGTVMYDPARTDDRFRMWYLCFTPTWNTDYSEAIDKRSGCVAYAVSRDGVSWTRPALAIHAHGTRRDTNIVIPHVHGFAGVTLDPREPKPERRYRAQVRGAGGHLALFSADGIHWSEPVRMNVDGFDRSSVHWDPVNEQWIASTKSWYRPEPGHGGWRGRGYQASADFVHWPHPAEFMTATEPGGSEIVYNLDVFYYESLFFGAWGRYRHEPDGLLDVQLAVSRNARHWLRPSPDAWLPLTPLPPGHRRQLLPRSPETGVDPFDSGVPWDYANNSINLLGPLRVGDELWIYYSGRTSDHRSNPQTGAIGLARMRLDGFYSLDAGEQPGSLVTRIVELENPVLRLNADARGGELRVEITDPEGRPIAPFTFDNCLPLTTDHLRHRVAWNGATDLSALLGRRVRLHFSLRNARLYALWTGEERLWSTPDTTTWQKRTFP